MGKRKNKGGNKSAPAGARVEIVSGRTNVNYAATSSNILPIQPSSFARCLAIADVFQFYRFTKLRVTVIPVDNSVVVAYAPGAAFDTAPTTFAALIELPIAKYHGSAKFMETVMDVPRKELLGDAQIPWFKTIVGTPAAQFETQGNLYVTTGGGANGGILVIEWTVEFQSWNLAAQSPLVYLPGSVEQGSPSTSGDDKKRSADCLVVGGVTYRRSHA